MTLKRVAVWLVWVPVIIYAVTVSRQFFHVANSAIYLSTDDGVANISYALATEGRYGFMSSPILAGMARHDGLFSYGPFYFYIGAALIWMFGYNLVVLRSIHLAVMLGIAAIAGRWFSGAAAGGVGALFALGLLMAFERAHWPMVRPDSIVDLFAIGFVIAAGLAIRTSQARYWIAGGVAASCAAFTHLVAWSLIPAAAVTVMVAYAAGARDPEGGWTPAAIVKPMLALIAGGLIGAALFYASFGFRIGDQLAFLTDYQRYTGSMSGLANPGGSFTALLSRHFELAYWYLPYPMAYLVWLVLIASVAGVAAAMVWRSLPSRRTVLALIAPPTVVWVVYFGSLGVYNNFHQGYAMLNQIMFLWCGAALIAATLAALEPWPGVRRFASAAVWIVAFVLGLGMITVLAPRTNYRALAAETMTPIDQYVDAALEAIPARARAWGSVELGIEHPGRIQLIQFWDGIKVLESVAPEQRGRLFPDYLVWGSVENGMNTSVVLELSGAERALDHERSKGLASWRLVDAFPAARYDLVSITSGPPYGTTRVYGWREGVPPIAAPIVRVYDPTEKQWVSALGTPSVVATTSSSPAVVSHGGARRTAVQTVRGELAAGKYLLKVGLLPSLTLTDAATVMATATTDIQADVTQPFSGVDVSPWFADQTAAFLVYHHAGGPMFVSQFGTNKPAIAGVEAWPLLALTNYRDRRREAPAEIPLPAAQWTASFPEISVTAQGQDAVAVVGNTTLYGYQAYGPRIAVEPGQRMRLRVPVTVTAGRGCVGVLDGTELSWLLAPDSLKGEYEFQINDSRTVKPVLADCSGSPAAVQQLRATIGSGSYALWSDRDEPYVDQIMREFSKVRPR